MTIPELYDIFKQYIDKKLDNLSEKIKVLFDDYKVKTVADNLDIIKDANGKYIGSGSELPLTRNDGTPLHYGDMFELNGQLMVYTQDNGWVNVSNLGQYVDSGTDLGHSIMYTANKTAQNEEIVVKSGWNAFSVDNLQISPGSEIIIEDNATYKVI